MSLNQRIAYQVNRPVFFVYNDFGHLCIVKHVKKKLVKTAILLKILIKTDIL